jgi:hypothetical protein
VVTHRTRPEDEPAPLPVDHMVKINGASGRGPATARSYSAVLTAALGVRTWYYGSTHDSVARDSGQLEFHVIGTPDQIAAAQVLMTAFTPELVAVETAARKAEVARQKNLPAGHPDRNSYEPNRRSRQAMEKFASELATLIQASVRDAYPAPDSPFGALLLTATATWNTVPEVTKRRKQHLPDSYAVWFAPVTPEPVTASA